jgi:malate synthase
LLVQTCHQHGAHAMGGMSAFIPSKDEKVNEQAFAKVKEDKRTEASQGYDGTWVAHPGLVNLAVEEFQKVLKGNVHQKEVMRKDVSIRGSELIDFTIENAVITEEGLRTNINVGILYIESWLRGIGAAALYNLMEDAATAEISRAQVWQWIQHKCKTDDGQAINIERVSELVTSEVAKIQEMIGAERFEKGRFIDATALFLDLVGKSKCVDFLTIPAYKKLK